MIPVLSTTSDRETKGEIVSTYPAGLTLGQKPEVVLFDNNFALLKVMKLKNIWFKAAIGQTLIDVLVVVTFYFLIPVGAAVLGVVLAILFFPKQVYNGKRGNLEALALTAVEKESPQEKDLSSQSFNYILTSKEIEKCYKDAIGYFQSHNDNLAQKEINKLLNSNAAFSIKQKCQVLMSYLEIPTFDTLKDNFSYSEVSKEPMLYLDCWVSWDGRISNSIVNADGSYTCQLLVGYETMKNVDGIVTVYFEREPSILPDQAVKILGKIDYQDENIVLNGRAVYQSVKK